jgi:hypothetical protein
VSLSWFVFLMRLSAAALGGDTPLIAGTTNTTDTIDPKIPDFLHPSSQPLVPLAPLF